MRKNKSNLRYFQIPPPPSSSSGKTETQSRRNADAAPNPRILQFTTKPIVLNPHRRTSHAITCQLHMPTYSPALNGGARVDKRTYRAFIIDLATESTNGAELVPHDHRRRAVLVFRVAFWIMWIGLPAWLLRKLVTDQIHPLPGGTALLYFIVSRLSI